MLFFYNWVWIMLTSQLDLTTQLDFKYYIQDLPKKVPLPLTQVRFEG